MKDENANRICVLLDTEIEAVGGAEDSYWGGVGKIAVGVGGAVAAVAVGPALVAAAGVLGGAILIYQGYQEASSALNDAASGD